MEKLHTVSKNKTGADCGSDHEFLIAKFRVKLKIVGKNHQPFEYDINEIPYNYTVEVTNRFKGLDLVDRLPEEHYTGGGDQNHSQEKEMLKAKWLSEDVLQIAEKRRELKGKGEKERYIHLNAEFKEQQ